MASPHHVDLAEPRHRAFPHGAGRLLRGQGVGVRGPGVTVKRAEGTAVSADVRIVEMEIRHVKGPGSVKSGSHGQGQASQPRKVVGFQASLGLPGPEPFAVRDLIRHRGQAIVP